MNFVGIDLSAKEKNPTGIFVGDKIILSKVLYRDSEILNIIFKFEPAIISIDSPLSFKKPYRNGEKELIKLGFRPLPLSIKSMEHLYKRAIKLKRKIESYGNFIILETFPRAIEKIFGFSYKKFKIFFRNKHIYDAWLCYINSKCYYFKKYQELKDNIILPKI